VTNTTTPLPSKVERTARLRWIPLDKIKVNPAAQRELKQARVDRLVAHLDLDQIGNPVVNERQGSFYCIDGQHRIEALRQFGFTDETIQCWTHVGLSEAEEAERFLQINDTLVVEAHAKYRAAVNAGRHDECEIERVIRLNGCVITKDGLPGGIAAVGTVRRVYDRSGSTVLGRTVRIALRAYGDSGLSAQVIDGLGLLCQRYNGDVNDDEAVERLAAAHGGVNGLLGHAEKLRRQTGERQGVCVAAAAVEIINRGKGGKKLPSWWKT
jgi:hypothetical protein